MVTWLYWGDRNGVSDCRIQKVDSLGKLLGEWLPASHGIPFEERFSVFVPSANGLLLRESLHNRVGVLTDTGWMARYRFDFGDLNIPSECFEQSDAARATQMLAEKPFAALD